MKPKIAMNKKTVSDNALTENESSISAEIDDFLILSDKIRIQIGSFIAHTFISTLAVILTVAGLLLGKFLDFGVQRLLMFIYFGIIWCLISATTANHFLRTWGKYCDEFAKTLTKKYNNSVNSKMLLPIIGRSEFQKAVFRVAVLYYFGLLGILLFLSIEYIIKTTSFRGI